MKQMQFLVPVGARVAECGLDSEYMQYDLSLEAAADRWISIPNTALGFRLHAGDNGTRLSIRKRGRVVWVSCFCLGVDQYLPVFRKVEDLYRAQGLGVPESPGVENWVHAVPFVEDLLEDVEISIIQKLTVVLFWFAFKERLEKVNLLN